MTTFEGRISRTVIVSLEKADVIDYRQWIRISSLVSLYYDVYELELVVNSLFQFVI
jgi:hypothetical protein